MERLPFPPPRVTGFPSTCDDFARRPLDIQERVITDPANTFFAQMRGDAMKHRRVPDGALLVIERRQTFSHDQIVLAWCAGEFLLRELARYDGHAVLMAGPDWPVVEIVEGVTLLGLLRWSANSHCGLPMADVPVVS